MSDLGELLAGSSGSRVLLRRIVDKIEPEPTTGCWLWSGTGSCGYGKFSVNGRMRWAHRTVYEVFCGPIPRGLTLDHLCRVTWCVNPAHLEPVTQRENNLRGTSLAAANAKKKVCGKCGGEFYRRKRGNRACRQCERALARADYAANRSEHLAECRRSYQRHRAARLAKQREWVSRNPEKVAAYKRAYKLRHRHRG